MDLKALRAAAKELNETIGLVDDDGNDIEITKKMTEEELKKILKEATSLVKPTDVLSDETQEILDELSAGDDEDEPEDDDEDEGDAEDEDEDEGEDDDEDEPEETLYEKVEGAEKLADLKTLATDNAEFKPLRKKLNTFKKAKELKEAMLDLLDDIEADEAAEKIHQKNIASKPIKGSKNKPAKEEEEDDDEQEEEEDKPKRKGGPPKGVKPNFKKEGSMAEFMDNLVKKGGTWEELAKTCEKEGKKRELRTKFTPSTMKAHVKFRVSKDPKFLGKLKMTNDGIK